MNIWAIVLYVLEVFTLLNVCLSLRIAKLGPQKMNTAGGVFGLIAVALGITYAALTALTLPSFFATWARGEWYYTLRRAVLVTLNSVAGIIIVSILAFAG